MSRNWLIPVVLFLVLASARVLNWGLIHDEGVTYDVSMYHLDLSDRVPPDGEPRGLPEVLEAGAITGLSELFGVLASDRSIHPPGYFALLHGWTRLFGSSFLALRLPGIVIGALAVFAMFHLMLCMTHSRTAAIGASLLLAVSPAHIGYALYLRAYGLEIAVAIASCFVLLRWHERMFEAGEWRWFGAFTVLSALGIYAVYHYLFVLLFQFTFLLIVAWVAPKRSFTSDLARAVASGIGIVILYLPWLPHLAATLARLEGRQFYFAGFTPLAEWPERLFDMAVRSTLGDAADWRQVAFVILLLGLIGLVVVIVRQQPGKEGLAEAGTGGTGLSRPHAILWSCFLVYPLAMIAADVARDTHTFLVWKTSIIMLPLSIVSIVLVLQKLRRPRMRVAALSICIAVVFSATATNIAIAAFRDLPGHDELSRHLRKNDREDHVVVLNTDRRGFALTALVHWKNLGIRNVRIALGPRNRLDEVAASLIADPAVAQITFVTLRRNGYGDFNWSDEETHRIETAVKAEGKTLQRFKQRVLYTHAIGH